jgi:hypothetical protein
MKIVEFLIDETSETGVKTISLVDSPAMESDFISFKHEKAKPKYISLEKEGKEYKQVVAGLSMIPDKLIYRFDPETGEEYNGYFSQKTIEQIRNKYHKEMQTSNVNLNHEENNYIDAYLIESYILSSQERVDEVTSQGIDGATLGAWYTQFKIEDKEIFQKVLDGEYNGFSIEAFLNKEMKSSLKNNFKEKEKKMKKSLIQKFKDFLETLEAEDKQIQETEDKFEEALVPEENIIVIWGEIGAEVTKKYTNEEGEEVTEPIGQGEFVIEDGRIIVVDENSMLIEVKEAEVEEEESKDEVKAVEEPAGDTVVSYTEVGKAVTVDGETASEGTITLDNGIVLVIDADGILVEIQEPEAEEANTEVNAEENAEVPAEENTEESISMPDEVKAWLTSIAGEFDDGEIYVSFIKSGGDLTYGNVSTWADIKMSKESNTKVTELEKQVKELNEKLSEPISEPKLTDESNTSDNVKELTVYERIARRKGIQSV